ncbi:hypothetical protein EO087_06500 [Dyella sp. M7H15-1]|uniref:hypothetical protein n=1 Tax=Dyella sp. M7H15-1 TaxID=2501295 RepID=UPI0010050726|nr:hypothetical protein [Dyella sp. M7H15-1]QAU23677.1 hypothetical protein EO087_06500 [Dyella sp. M7H15-1]
MDNSRPIASLGAYGGYSSKIHPVENSNVKTEVNSPIKVAVNNLAKGCSELIHLMIPVSSTREFIDINKIFAYGCFDKRHVYEEVRKKTDEETRVIVDRLDVHGELIGRNRKAAPVKSSEWRKIIRSDHIDRTEYEVARNKFIKNLAELIMLSLKSNAGNCFEKALMATVMFRLAFEKHLMNNGFTKHEIDDANIRITILDNHGAGGDHVVGSIKMTIAGVDEELLIDPLMDGSVVEKSDISQFYSDNESVYCSGATSVFKEITVYADALNDPEFLGLIKQKLERMHHVDFDHFDPEAIAHGLHRKPFAESRGKR